MNRYTHEEAACKLCPFKFSRRPGDGVNCSASVCMAWRWEDPEWQATSHRRDFDKWENAIDSDEKVIKIQVYKNSDQTNEFISQGWEQYWPEWLKKHKGLAYTQPDRYHSESYLRRKWPETRTGYCGLAEPRLSEVSVSS